MDIGLSDVLAVCCGALVGFSLGTIGGGGSILAVPLLVYVVGVKSPHIAIGTSSVAVALSALANLIDHARQGHVCWPVAILFAACGMAGAVAGSTLGKYTDGQKLLTLFGMLMIAVAVSMARRTQRRGDAEVRLDAGNVPSIAGIGLGVGALAGFFGIGGGFLVVPGLVAATAMPMIVAIGSSLVSVTTFGLTTAANYAMSGLIDWQLVALFVGGGILGGLAGARLAAMLAARQRMLAMLFAVVIAGVGVYIVIRGIINMAGA